MHSKSFVFDQVKFVWYIECKQKIVQCTTWSIEVWKTSCACFYEAKLQVMWY